MIAQRLPVGFILALALSACGGGGGASSSPSTSPAPTPVATTPPAQAEKPLQIAPLANTTANTGPALALDRNGNVTAFWQLSAQGTVFASRLAAGSKTWSVPHAAGGAGAYEFRQISTPNGDIIVTRRSWADPQNPVTVFNRFNAATGQWQGEARFDAVIGMAWNTPALTVDSKGVVTAVTVGDVFTSLYATRLDPASGTWSSPVRISLDYSAFINSPTMQTDAAGNIILAWMHGMENAAMVSRYSAATGTWSVPQNLDPQGGKWELALAQDARGGATFAWVHGSAKSATQTIRAARFDPATDSWSTPVDVTGALPAAEYHGLAMASTAAGASTLVYLNNAGFYSVHSDGPTSNWGAMRNIVPSANATGHGTLSVSAAGGLALTYESGGLLYAVRDPAASGQWGAPKLIDGGPGVPSLQATYSTHVQDASGGLLVAWSGPAPAGSATPSMLASLRWR